MLDLNNLLTNQKADVQTFIGNSLASPRVWQKWQKPRGVNFVYIFLLGGGGGGGGGGRSTVAAGAGGGGGGGSGSSMQALYPADSIPNTLYLCIASGGAGGAITASGSSATDSWVTIYPDTVGAIALAYCRGGSGGGAGANGAGGVGGAGGINSFGAQLASLGITTLVVAGDSGQTGSYNINGSDKAFPIGGAIASGGAAGGSLGGPTIGTDGFIGGWITTTGFPSVAPLYTTGAAGGSGTGTGADTFGQNGSNGVQLIPKLPIFLGGNGGGGGGGSSDAGGNGGGNGGVGAYGAGGGGGGGAASGRVVGIGGDGGPGLAIIVSY